MKKRNRITLCLVAGVLILAVSATAAFGSVNGYAKYKNALKDLALEETNFTAAGQLTMSFDGETIVTMSGDYAHAGADYSSHTRTERGGTVQEEYDTVLNGVNTWFSADKDYYYQSQVDREETNLLGYNQDDEMENRLITFVELAADTVVGDLKNNFVEVGAENGSTLYQVNISQSQVPSLVNAGLSLFAYSMAETNSEPYQVQFEDYDQNAFHYYEETTGETLSDEFKDHYRNGGDDAWYEANEAQLEKFYEVTSECWEEEYYKVLEEKGKGVVYVHPDGSYDYYADNAAFAAAHPEETMDDLYQYVGQDMTLEDVDCTFGVDSQGRLTSNQIQVTFNTTGEDGSHHKMVIAIDLTVKDYGATTVQPLDVGERTEAH